MTESVFKNDLLISLRQLNCRFLFAGTGAGATDLCRQHPEIELVIVDIDLPVINGIETIKESTF